MLYLTVRYLLSFVLVSPHSCMHTLLQFGTTNEFLGNIELCESRPDVKTLYSDCGVFRKPVIVTSLSWLYDMN
jgi:hypothetical protein